MRGGFRGSLVERDRLRKPPFLHFDIGERQETPGAEIPPRDAREFGPGPGAFADLSERETAKVGRLVAGFRLTLSAVAGEKLERRAVLAPRIGDFGELDRRLCRLPARRGGEHSPVETLRPPLVRFEAREEQERLVQRSAVEPRRIGSGRPPGRRVFPATRELGGRFEPGRRGDRRGGRACDERYENDALHGCRSRSPGPRGAAAALTERPRVPPRT